MSLPAELHQNQIVRVAIDVPLNKLFDYVWDAQELGSKPEKNQLVSVEFGKKKVVALVVEIFQTTDIELEKLKKVLAVAPLDVLTDDLVEMAKFASQYYLKSLGEVIIPSIPKYWRDAKKWPLLCKPKRKTKVEKTESPDQALDKKLNDQQKNVVDQLLKVSAENKFSPILLQGVTGSGKTRTYTQWLSSVLEKPQHQALVLVPEINLTPQLEAHMRAAFPDKEMVVLHSGMTDRDRADAWSKALQGQAQIILGTRLAVMTPLPRLKAIVVDEEHDLSYKQQESLRYSARDLAVWRAQYQQIPIVLVSATPSMETWHKALTGKYLKCELTERASQNASWPQVLLVDLNQTEHKKTNQGMTPYLEQLIGQQLQQNQQSLLFINRRGYSPVLSCQNCTWVSGCTKCSAHMVLHKDLDARRCLCCHHCGLIKPIPKACPECGNADLLPLGLGTQKIEEYLSKAFPGKKVIRIDADTTRKKGSAEKLFEEVHQGQADIVVGTQMITKGHDYQSVGLVGVLDSDAALYSHDYRASERLFAQLMQVAGRAGRSGQAQLPKVVIQTRYPEAHPYQYLLKHDVDGFMHSLLLERQEMGLPPYTYQALIHSEYKTIDLAVKLLSESLAMARQQSNWPKGVSTSDVVPKTMVRLAGKERAQLLIESSHRQHLQHALECMRWALTETAKKGVGWYIERDPILL